MMEVYTCTDHDCVWPVGVASIVVAGSEARARDLLDEALVKGGLKPSDGKPYTLQKVSILEESATVLLDGDY